MNEVSKIILKSLSDLNDTLEQASLKSIKQDTELYGREGILDSLAFITFVTDLEEKPNQTYNKAVALANEEAINQNSTPFKNILTLTKHIEYLLQKN